MLFSQQNERNGLCKCSSVSYTTATGPWNLHVQRQLALELYIKCLRTKSQLYSFMVCAMQRYAFVSRALQHDENFLLLRLYSKNSNILLKERFEDCMIIFCVKTYLVVTKGRFGFLNPVFNMIFFVGFCYC